MINGVATKLIRQYQIEKKNKKNMNSNKKNMNSNKKNMNSNKRKVTKYTIRALRVLKYRMEVYKRQAKLFMKFGLLHIGQLLKLITFVNLMIKRREEAQEYIAAFGRKRVFVKRLGIFGGQSETKNRVIQLMLLTMERRYREKISVSYCVLFPDMENLSYMSPKINEVRILITENELKKGKKFHKYVLFFSSSLNI